MSYSQQQVNYINSLQNQILIQQVAIEQAIKMQQLDQNNRYNNNSNNNQQYTNQGSGGGGDTIKNSQFLLEEGREFRGNALAESALARRKKRQSMIEGGGGGVASSSSSSTSPISIRSHRRSVSSQSSTISGLSSSTPSLILTSADESELLNQFPTNRKSSKESSHSSGESSQSTIELIPSFQSLKVEVDSPPREENEKDIIIRSNSPGKKLGLNSNQQPSRPSQMSRLSAALDGRTKRHSSSSSSTGTSNSILSQPQPIRAVSDGFPLSPFANSFNPIPTPASNQSSNPYQYSNSTEFNNPYLNNYNNNVILQNQNQQFYYNQDYSNTQTPIPPPSPNPYRQSPVLTAGTATPTRKPRGPPSDFESANFGSRLRKEAIKMLNGRMRTAS